MQFQAIFRSLTLLALGCLLISEPSEVATAQGIPAGAKTCTATPGKVTACNIQCPLTGGTIGVDVSITGRGFATGSVSCTDLKQWISCTASAVFIADDTCSASGPFNTYIYLPEAKPLTPMMQCEASEGAKWFFGYIGPPKSSTITCWLK